VIGRIVRSVDFERVLGSPIRARSAHFAVHFLESRPSLPAKPRAMAVSTELSTGQAPEESVAVDESGPGACWLGTVVPKRHARRAATRNLLKRQIHRAASHHEQRMAHGLWVVRLRSPFDRKNFPSASSEALRTCAGEELAALLADATCRVGAS